MFHNLTEFEIDAIEFTVTARFVHLDMPIGQRDVEIGLEFDCVDLQRHRAFLFSESILRDLYGPEAMLGVNGRGYLAQVSEKQADPAHLALAEHDLTFPDAQAMEPTDKVRQVVYNYASRRYEVAYPEIELRPDDHLITQYYHARSGLWVTVPQ